MCFGDTEGPPQLCELPIRRVESLSIVSVDRMRYFAASYKSLEGQKEIVRGHVNTKF